MKIIDKGDCYNYSFYKNIGLDRPVEVSSINTPTEGWIKEFISPDFQYGRSIIVNYFNYYCLINDKGYVRELGDKVSLQEVLDFRNWCIQYYIEKKFPWQREEYYGKE